jgi:hypothetical protein
MLASSGRQDGQVTDSTAMLAGLVNLRRKTPDPMADYVADGTRMLRWVQATVAHVSALTGRTQQEVLRDALVGSTPLPADLLDAHYADLYGKTRPRT